MSETTTKAEATPGPWRVEERFNERQVVVLASVEERVSVVVAAGGMSSIEQHANARLIAAAPDMLAALKKWKLIPRPWIDGTIGRLGTVTLAEWDAACEAIEAAIRKAEQG